MRPSSLFFPSSLLFPPFFFVVDRAQPETLQWRGYLSAPVRHSIRTDGSSVIKMALRYNGERVRTQECILASVFTVGTTISVINALFTETGLFHSTKGKIR